MLATTSVTQIANFGLSGVAVKFVAKYIARGEDEKVSGVIQTSALSIAIFTGIILLIGYPVIKWALGLVIQHEPLSYAISVLPLALFAFWFLMITNIFQSGIDGYQRMDLRSLLFIGGTVLNLLLCFMLAPIYGLFGVAWAQFIQNLTMMIASWVLLKKCLPVLPTFPSKWDRNLFKEVIGYGINFQLITLSSMVYDPITKALLSKFGGLSMVGYYEMGSKLVQQSRALIVSANQVLVPAIANLHEQVPEKVKEVYLTSYQLLFYLAVPLYSLVIVCTPIISEIWIGHYEKVFVVLTTLLAVGWFFNTLAGPAYFANLGTGELRWNVVGHIAIGLLNAGLGFLLGFLYGGFGVVIAWALSLVLGSSPIYLSYHLKQKIPLAELLPNASRIIIATCFIGLLSAMIIKDELSRGSNTVTLHSLIPLGFSIMIIIPLWFHPMRRCLVTWVNNELLNMKLGA